MNEKLVSTEPLNGEAADASGVEKFLQEETAVHAAVRMLLGSKTPVLQGKLVNAGPVPIRKKISAALTWLEKAGVLKREQSRVESTTVPVIRICENYRALLQKVCSVEIQKLNKHSDINGNGQVKSKTEKKPRGRPFTNVHSLSALQTLLEAPKGLSRAEVNETAGTHSHTRNSFWQMMKKKEWITQNNDHVVLTAKGKKEIMQIMEASKHLLPTE